MLLVFAVLAVVNRQVKLKLYGLIADRLFILKTISASGRNFIIANVMRLGGLGVMIAPHQSLAIGPFGITMAKI
jgi:hypothetical protein